MSTKMNQGQEVLLDTGHKKLTRMATQDGDIVLEIYEERDVEEWRRRILTYKAKDAVLEYTAICSGWDLEPWCFEYGECIVWRLPLSLIPKDKADELIEKLKSAKTFKDFASIVKEAEALVREIEKEG